MPAVSIIVIGIAAVLTFCGLGTCLGIGAFLEHRTIAPGDRARRDRVPS